MIKAEVFIASITKVMISWTHYLEIRWKYLQRGQNPIHYVTFMFVDYFHLFSYVVCFISVIVAYRSLITVLINPLLKREVLI